MKIALVEDKGKINWQQGKDELAIKAAKTFPSEYAPAFRIKSDSLMQKAAFQILSGSNR